MTATRFKFKLRGDFEGDEQLLPLFVMAAAMLIAIIVLMTSIATAIERNAPTGYWNQPEGWDIFGDTQYNYILPLAGFNVTNYNHTHVAETDNASRKIEFDISGTAEFTDWTYLTVRLVRDFGDGMDQLTHFRVQYDDFVCIHVKKGTKDRWIQLPYDGMLTRGPFYRSENGTQTLAYFEVFRTNFTVVLETTQIDNANHSSMIWAGNYNIRIAYNTEIGDASMSASMWTILGQILTLQLPDVNRIVNLLFAVPIWAAMGFMVFTVLSRVIPFISGG